MYIKTIDYTQPIKVPDYIAARTVSGSHEKYKTTSKLPSAHECRGSFYRTRHLSYLI